ncbi:MAG: hypothetical protein J0G29_04110 [Alphaproteobacteria bacterium]|mgnify:CR=1 FL=1|nr:hypothetical protein [Alphaproteobacteria bacterium]OJV46822.1 MAG: hypothetical protein BGO28_04265 [Alphaproteobacteria bacterium 43-37]
MSKFGLFLKDWYPVVWRSLCLAILIGLTLGLSSGYALEAWSSMDTFELSIALGCALWFVSLISAIYITELAIKRKIRKYAYVLTPNQGMTTQKTPVNHNQRFFTRKF